MVSGEDAYKALTEAIGWVPAVGPWAGWDELTDDLRERYERFAAVLEADGWKPGRMPVSLYEQDLEKKLEDADYRREFIAGVSELVRADERDRIIALLEADLAELRKGQLTVDVVQADCVEELIALIKGEE